MTRPLARWWAVVATGIALASVTSHAAQWPTDDDHSLPCRPTIACTADIVPPGTVEIELGGLARDTPTGTFVQTPVLIKATLATWLQLQISSNGYTDSVGSPTTRYVDDLAVGWKLHLADQREDMPSLAVSGELSVPLGDQPGYIRTYDGLFTLYVTKDFGRVHADFNAGVNLWRLEATPLVQGFATLALTFDAGHALSPMIEGYYFSDAAPVAWRDAGILFALGWAARPWLVLDVGGDVGLIQTTRDFSGFAGVTVIVGRLWR